MTSTTHEPADGPRQLSIEHALQANDLPRFSVDERFSLGSSEGQELFNIAGAVLTDDGTLVVADAGNYQLLIAPRRGREVRAVGRRGAGPLEFESIGAIAWSPGWGLGVYDPRLARITQLDSRGNLVEESNAQVTGMREIAFGGVTTEGEFLFGTYPMARELLDQPTGPRRDSLTLTFVGMDTAVDGSQCRVLGSELYLAHHEGVTASIRVPNGTHMAFAAFETGFLVADLALAHLEIHGADCEPKESFDLSFEPLSLSATQQRTTRDSVVNWARDLRARAPLPDNIASWFSEAADAVPVRSTIPPLASLAADPSGSIWIEISPAYSLSENHVWIVILPEGREAVVEGPPLAQRILFVSMAGIVGVERDAFDVETIRVHDVKRIDDSS